MASRKLVLSLCVLGLMGAILVAQPGEESNAGKAMIDAGKKFLAALPQEQRKQATFDYDSDERLNWHFIPRPRKGLPLRDMEGEALKAAHTFIRSGLSSAGYEQALNIMSLEEVLYLLETGDREERRKRRDPRNYSLSVFGEPAERGTWGWRVEGHHLSLNFSVKDGQVVAGTPEFFGANPARIDAGPERTIRVLGTEEDIARRILKACPADQRDTLWVDKKAPDDIRGGGEPQPAQTDPVGLPASKMSADQKKLLQALLTEYLKNMPASVASERRERINSAGIDKIHFAWWGSSELNERHAYRVQGPTFLIEYNNTQNNANHVHSVWRNMAGDFNKPIQK